MVYDDQRVSVVKEFARCDGRTPAEVSADAKLLRRRLLRCLGRSRRLDRFDVLPWLPVGAIGVVRALVAVTGVPAFLGAAIGRAGVPSMAAGSVRERGRDSQQNCHGQGADNEWEKKA
jgi:hypothetical protein